MYAELLLWPTVVQIQAVANSLSTLVDNTNLDFDKPPLTSKHPVFGRVVAGMDVVDAIAKFETSANNLPFEDVVIESATIRQDS